VAGFAWWAVRPIKPACNWADALLRGDLGEALACSITW